LHLLDAFKPRCYANQLLNAISLVVASVRCTETTLLRGILWCSHSTETVASVRCTETTLLRLWSRLSLIGSALHLFDALKLRCYKPLTAYCRLRTELHLFDALKLRCYGRTQY